MFLALATDINLRDEIATGRAAKPAAEYLTGALMEFKHHLADEKPAQMDIRECLESLPLFSDLTGPEIELLVPLCRVLEGGIGYYILEEGASVHTIFFLISGEANVRKEGTLLATVGKGAVLGEMSLLNHGSAFATIQAKCAFKAIAIEQAAFARLLEEHARLGYKILKKIARLLALRLMMTDAKLADCMNIPHDYQHDTGSQPGPSCPRL